MKTVYWSLTCMWIAKHCIFYLNEIWKLYITYHFFVCGEYNSEIGRHMLIFCFLIFKILTLVYFSILNNIKCYKNEWIDDKLKNMHFWWVTVKIFESCFLSVINKWSVSVPITFALNMFPLYKWCKRNLYLGLAELAQMPNL